MILEINTIQEIILQSGLFILGLLHIIFIFVLFTRIILGVLKGFLKN
jgi:hypothetical protein